MLQIAREKKLHYYKGHNIGGMILLKPTMRFFAIGKKIRKF